MDGHIPEQSGAAVAKRDLITIGKREELGHPFADDTNKVFDRGPAM
jgi:hypothetical protein